ncbi:MAG TPA: hypothetical protein VJU82_01365 [Acidobacteriaceae bacterium]|nr:hypothetical protein [Acidobacteriaceae bacterium]
MRLQAVTAALAKGGVLAAVLATCWAVPAQSGNTLLKPADMERLFPATVYYDGQSAPAQLRNSGGVKFSDGHYVLASLVDTSGYSSTLTSKYQGYLITEVPLTIAGKHLVPGAYGIGLVADDKFVLTDLGGNTLLTESSKADSAMARPRPLQVTVDPAGGFRLYVGRRYVQFAR